MTSPEESLFTLISQVNLAACQHLVEQHPDLNINHQRSPADGTLLHSAVRNAQNSGAIVTWLLTRPGIYPNKRDQEGNAPIHIAVNLGHLEAFKALLADERVDVNLEDLNKRTPLWLAAASGATPFLQYLIVSERHFSPTRAGNWVSKGKKLQASPLEIAQTNGHAKFARLLQAFIANRDDARRDTSFALGRLGHLASGYFAVVVFLCDGLLRPAGGGDDGNGDGETGKAAAVKFLRMASRLPMELQMVLCCRACGIASETIRPGDAETAFKDLAKSFS